VRHVFFTFVDVGAILRNNSRDPKKRPIFFGKAGNVFFVVADILQNFFVQADDAVDIEMQCDILYILSTLCENDLHRKELFGNQVRTEIVAFKGKIQ